MCLRGTGGTRAMRIRAAAGHNPACLHLKSQSFSTQLLIRYTISYSGRFAIDHKRDNPNALIWILCLTSCGQRSSPSAVVHGTSAANQFTAELQPWLPLHAGTRYLEQLDGARTDATSPATMPIRNRCKQSRPGCDTIASRYPRAHPISISLSAIIHHCISNHPPASAHRQHPRLAVWR